MFAFDFKFISADIDLTRSKIFVTVIEPLHGGGGGGEGEVSSRKSVVQSTCRYDVTTRVSNFQNGEQSVHRRNGLKF